MRGSGERLFTFCEINSGTLERETWAQILKELWGWDIYFVLAFALIKPWQLDRVADINNPSIQTKAGGS